MMDYLEVEMVCEILIPRQVSFLIMGLNTGPVPLSYIVNLCVNLCLRSLKTFILRDSRMLPLVLNITLVYQMQCHILIFLIVHFSLITSILTENPGNCLLPIAT